MAVHGIPVHIPDSRLKRSSEAQLSTENWVASFKEHDKKFNCLTTIKDGQGLIIFDIGIEYFNREAFQAESRSPCSMAGYP